MNEDKARELEQVFAEAGPAHHQAYIATNGDDPEWPIWYADYLKNKVEFIVDRTYTRSEMIYFMVLADRQHKATGGIEPWPRFYANLLLSNPGL